MNKAKTFIPMIKLFGSKITGITIGMKNGLYRINFGTGVSGNDNELLFDDMTNANRFLRRLYNHSNANTELKNSTISKGAIEIKYNHRNMTQMYYFRPDSCPVNDMIACHFDKVLANTAWNGIYGFCQNKHLLRISEPYNIVQTKLLMAYDAHKITKEMYARQNHDYKNSYNVACEALAAVYWNAYELSENGQAIQHKDFETYKKIRNMFVEIAENRLPLVR